MIFNKICQHKMTIQQIRLLAFMDTYLGVLIPPRMRPHPPLETFLWEISLCLLTIIILYLQTDPPLCQYMFLYVVLWALLLLVKRKMTKHKQTSSNKSPLIYWLAQLTKAIAKGMDEWVHQKYEFKFLLAFGLNYTFALFCIRAWA